MVQALTVFREVPGQRVIRLERFDQLELHVAHIQMSQPNADVGQFLAEEHREPEQVTIKLECFGGISDNYCHVIESVKHAETMDVRRARLKSGNRRTVGASRRIPPTP